MTQPTPEQSEMFERALGMLPGRLANTARQLLDTWVGRVGLGTAWSLQRIQIFDRSMAVAAQLFTSIFPILILGASWIGSTEGGLNDVLGIPAAAGDQVADEFSSGGTAGFGIIGAIIVLASATSLSRALSRAFAAIWALPKPKSNAASAWRWVVAVLAIALSLVAMRQSYVLVAPMPPATLWRTGLSLLLSVAIGLFVPWILLKAAVTTRGLLPGAVLFGVALTAMHPFTAIWLAHLVESSAARYGTIGIAFTYLAWLYVIAWAYLATAVLGQVLVSDPGRIGRRLAGPSPLIRMHRADGEERVLVDDEP